MQSARQIKDVHREARELIKTRPGSAEQPEPLLEHSTASRPSSAAAQAQPTSQADEQPPPMDEAVRAGPCTGQDAEVAASRAAAAERGTTDSSQHVVGSLSGTRAGMDGSDVSDVHDYEQETLSPLERDVAIAAEQVSTCSCFCQVFSWACIDWEDTQPDAAFLFSLCVSEAESRLEEVL
jgi:hypothetical protein